MIKIYRIKSLSFFFILICFDFSVYAQLNAAFSASIIQGCSPLIVQFHDMSSGSPAQWYWDFGDGTSSSQQNPAVIYSASGVYTVRLIVRNSTNQDYEEKQNYITVFQSALPQFISVVDSGCAPLKVAFRNITSLLNIQVQSWLWNFGDGAADSSQNPTHIFQTKGIYSISLTAKTAQGCENIFILPGAGRAGNQPKADFTVSPLNGC